MAFAHSVELVVEDAGRSAVIDAWDRYDISIDMHKPGSPWTYSIWRSDNPDISGFSSNPAKWSTTWQVLNSDLVKLGGNVRFRIDGATQLNGQIESIDWHTDQNSGAGITLSGRDLAGPALDWRCDPAITLKGRSLHDVLQELFNTVGADVIIGAGADAAREVQARARPGAHRQAGTGRKKLTKVVDIAHAQTGETVWQVAESICKRMGFMMWVAPTSDWPNEMALIVDVPNYEQDDAYVFGRRPVPGTDVVSHDSNILMSDFSVQIRDIPTFVYSGGRAQRGDKDPKRIKTFTENAYIKQFPIVSKGLIQHPYWLTNKRARSIDAANKYAERHLAEANRHFRKYQCTVQGHGQFTGEGNDTKLYAVNSMARVYDRVGGFTLLDESMLITRVGFMGSRATGQLTRLEMITKDSFKITPDEGP